MRKLFTIFFLLMSAVAVAQVPITATSITDAFEQPLPLARLCFAPVDVARNAVGFRVGSVNVIPNETCGKVTNGVLESGKSVAPSPAGLYYHIYIKAAVSNVTLRDYGLAPITGSSWSLDTFDPNGSLPAPLTAGTITTLSPGAGAYCNVTGTGPFLLNCGIPAGAPGVTPTFTVGAVSTLAAGSPATVGLTGGPNYVMNIAIPAGAAGASTTLPASGVVVATSPSTGRAGLYSDIVALFASGGCAGFLKSDGTCPSSSGAVLPGSGLVFATSSTTGRAGLYSDVVALFGSGSCTGFLKYDGTCASSSGGASLTGTAGLPLAYSGSGNGATIDPTAASQRLLPTTAGTPPTPVFPIDATGATYTNGIYCNGDSITADTYDPPGYCADLGTTLGKSVTNTAVSGSEAMDATNRMFNDIDPGAAPASLYLEMVGTNDGNNNGIGPHENVFNQAQFSMGTWATTPRANKIKGSDVSLATNWVADTTYSKVTGAGTYTNGSVQPFSYTTTAFNQGLGFHYRCIDGPGSYAGVGLTDNSSAGGYFTAVDSGANVSLKFLSFTTTPIAASNGSMYGVCTGFLPVPPGGGRPVGTYSLTFTNNAPTGQVGGSSYTVAPIATIFGCGAGAAGCGSGAGTGAACTPTITSGSISCPMSTIGTGYTGPCWVSFKGGDGVGAWGTCQTNGTGGVASITMQPSYYTAILDVFLAPAPGTVTATSPLLYMLGTPKQGCDTKPNITAQYNYDTQQDVILMQEYGWAGVQFADVRAGWLGTAAEAYGTPCGSLHPTHQTHANIAASLLLPKARVPELPSSPTALNAPYGLTSLPAFVPENSQVVTVGSSSSGGTLTLTPSGNRNPFKHNILLVQYTGVTGSINISTLIGNNTGADTVNGTTLSAIGGIGQSAWIDCANSNCRYISKMPPDTLNPTSSSAANFTYQSGLAATFSLILRAGVSGTDQAENLTYAGASGVNYWQAQMTAAHAYNIVDVSTSNQLRLSFIPGGTTELSASGVGVLRLGRLGGTGGTNIYGGTSTQVAGFSAGGVQELAIGTAIASAATIAPTSPVVHVTGTTTINTITAITTVCTTALLGCEVTLIPDGLWSTGTTGNIAIASTATVSRAMIMKYDPATTKWYPSY